MWIILAILLLLVILAILQRKEGAADDKKIGKNLEGFINMMDDLRRDE